jgi:hypothetical protein
LAERRAIQVSHDAVPAAVGASVSAVNLDLLAGEALVLADLKGIRRPLIGPVPGHEGFEIEVVGVRICPPHHQGRSTVQVRRHDRLQPFSLGTHSFGRCRVQLVTFGSAQPDSQAVLGLVLPVGGPAFVAAAPGFIRASGAMRSSDKGLRLFAEHAGHHRTSIPTKLYHLRCRQMGGGRGYTMVIDTRTAAGSAVLLPAEAYHPA